VRTARFTCAQCLIEPQGLKTLRRDRKEGARVGRPRRFRLGESRSLKDSVAQPMRTRGRKVRVFSDFGRAAETNLRRAGEEVREPQGSRALDVRSNRGPKKPHGEVEKRVQGSQDSGAFGSVGSWSLRTPWRGRARTQGSQGSGVPVGLRRKHSTARSKRVRKPQGLGALKFRLSRRA
jgi:hypothetical protein